ncbi:MAG: hypothetical protein Roseis2KO_22390 [Roseivirga sp.]
MRSVSVANFIHLSLNQGVNVLVALLINPILYQRLESERYGSITLSLSIVMLLGIVVSYGFHLNGPKRLALVVNDQEQRSSLINEIIVTRIVLSFLVTGLMLAAIGLFDLFSDYSLVLSFSLIIILGEALMPLFILQGLDRLSLLAKANAISKLGYLALVYFFVNGIEDAKWVNFFFGGSTVLVNVLLLFYIYKRWAIKFVWVRPYRLLARLRDNFQFFVSTIAGHVSVHGGFILLKSFVSDTELGQYSLAQRVAFLLRMVPVFLTQSVLQNASRLYAEDQQKFNNYLSKAYRIGLAITFAIGVVFMVTSPWVIWVVGGERVAYSAEVLRILCFIPFFGMLNVSNMVKILVAERKDVLSKATWGTAFIMLVLSSFGSYEFGGYGLAVALLLSEVVSFMLHYYLLKKNT